jgi:uncharacterized membrane protein
MKISRFYVSMAMLLIEDTAVPRVLYYIIGCNGLKPLVITPGMHTSDCMCIRVVGHVCAIAADFDVSILETYYGVLICFVFK